MSENKFIDLVAEEEIPNTAGNAIAAPTDPSEDLTEQDLADMHTAYGVLMTALLNTCGHNNPQVAIAALVSSAGTIAVQTMSENAARAYLSMAFTDMLGALANAYKDLRQKTEENSGAAGQGTH